MRYLRIIDALEISILTTYDDGETEEIAFSWYLANYKEQYLDIQLVFEQPELVSQRNAIDTIKVTFWGTEFFQSKTRKQVMYGTILTAALVR